MTRFNVRLGFDCFEDRNCPAQFVNEAFSVEFNTVLITELGDGPKKDAYVASAPDEDGVSVVLQVVVGGKEALVFPWLNASHLPTDANGIINRFWLDDPNTDDVEFEISSIELPDLSQALLAAPGPGGGPRLHVVSFDSLGKINHDASWYIAEESFRGGVEIGALSSLDTNGDDLQEITVFVDGGGKTVFRAYDPTTGAQTQSRYITDVEGYRPLGAGYGEYLLAPTYTRVGFLVMLDSNGDGLEDDPSQTGRVFLDNWEFQLSRDAGQNVSPTLVF